MVAPLQDVAADPKRAAAGFYPIRPTLARPDLNMPTQPLPLRSGSRSSVSSDARARRSASMIVPRRSAQQPPTPLLFPAPSETDNNVAGCPDPELPSRACAWRSRCAVHPRLLAKRSRNAAGSNFAFRRAMIVSATATIIRGGLALDLGAELSRANLIRAAQGEHRKAPIMRLARPTQGVLGSIFCRLLPTRSLASSPR
jgi:hypothetical protein